MKEIAPRLAIDRCAIRVNMDETVLRPCPVAGFGISDVDRKGQLVIDKSHATFLSCYLFS
jgi:hypothetical protein